MDLRLRQLFWGLPITAAAMGASADTRPAFTLDDYSPVLADPSALPATMPTPIYGPGDAMVLTPTAGFATEVEAVLAAVNRFNPLSINEDREYLGAILMRAGWYFYTATGGEPGSDALTTRIRFPRSYSVAAFWHTHGAAGEFRHFFSDVDTRLVRAQHRAFYLADYTGELKVFAPGDPVFSASRAKKLGLPHHHGFATGRVVADSGGSALPVRTHAADADRNMVAMETTRTAETCPPS